MIVTLTPNPSVDATQELGGPLEPGAVQRTVAYSHAPGGKGLNVSHAVHLAGAPTLALFPAANRDGFLSLVEDSEVPFENIPMTDLVRTNSTITEPDGRTTKINGLGPTLSEDTQAELVARLSAAAATADWVVLAGSLPRGVDKDWYATLVRAVRAANPNSQIAVDTSDGPMEALGARLDDSAPDLIKPNGLELGQLTGRDGLALERQAEDGDFSGVVEAAREVNARGIPQVLVTLGGAGAVLVTPEGAWIATPPPVEVKSTVGAGDSSLAGYILARSQGKNFADSLAQSVAYGTAAAGLPGTTIPRPEQLNIEETTVSAL